MSKAAESSFVGLADSLSKAIHKQFKTDFTIIQGSDSDDNYSNVTDWVSTGCQMLDLAISNIPNGGLPCGRISVLYGPEQSGKSMFVAHAIADTQRRGGIGVYIDAEFAFHEGYFNAIGVDTNPSNGKWFLILEKRLEVVFTVIEQLIQEVRKVDKNILLTIGLDSIASCITESEDSAEYSVKGYNTAKSMLLSTGLAKLTSLVAQENVCLIITNQVKYKMNLTNSFENPWRMPGGQSLPHYASVIVQLQKTKAIKATLNGLERIIGRSGIGTVEKNRLGPPGAKIKFSLYFDRGVDNLSSHVDYMLLFEIGKQSGSFIEYKTVDPTTGQEVKYREKGKGAFVRMLKSNPNVANEIWLEICKKFIMTYSISSDSIADELITESDDSVGSNE